MCVCVLVLAPIVCMGCVETSFVIFVCIHYFIIRHCFLSVTHTNGDEGHYCGGAGGMHVAISEILLSGNRYDFTFTYVQLA